MSKILDEHLLLAHYLREKVLTIDIWDGDSLMHFGVAKAPLHKHMRQGEPTNISAFELDICDPEHGVYLGGLQMSISNNGRRIPQEILGEIATTKTQNLP